MTNRTHRPIQYVRFGGGTGEVPTDFDMGRGRHRTPAFGLRRAVWDAAFGYISGFPLSAIVYYVATRSLHPAIERRALRREGVPFLNGYPVAKVFMDEVNLLPPVEPHIGTHPAGRASVFVEDPPRSLVYRLWLRMTGATL